MPAWAEMITVGRIVRPHGNKGHVVIVPDTDFVETRFAVGATVWREAGALVVTAMRVHDGRPIVGFDGFDSINAAETLRGAELRVPVEALPALGPGQYWHHDLVGCQVVTVAGDAVGVVAKVDEGATPLLVVTPAEGRGTGEILIPLADTMCRRIDVVAKVIEVALPEGLLDLNVTKGGGA
jgi:16S rRNA processing protein RimM